MSSKSKLCCLTGRKQEHTKPTIPLWKNLFTATTKVSLFIKNINNNKF